MIERKFIKQKMQEAQIQEFISKNVKNAGHSHTKMQKTPLGEKIIIHSSRPGLIVGKKGQNIKLLTKAMKKEFNLENPQIEMCEVEEPNLDANIIAERISDSLERFGTTKFKGIGHKVMSNVMEAGALGVEIIISGKIPSARARSWRFYSGYLKKCGDIALTGIRKSTVSAKLKTGIVGIKVSIMPPDIKLPDKINIIEEKETVVEEVKKEEETAKEDTNKEGKKKSKKTEKKTKKENKDGAED